MNAAAFIPLVGAIHESPAPPARLLNTSRPYMSAGRQEESLICLLTPPGDAKAGGSKRSRRLAYDIQSSLYMAAASSFRTVSCTLSTSARRVLAPKEISTMRSSVAGR